MWKLHSFSSFQYTHGVAQRLLGSYDTLPCVLNETVCQDLLHTLHFAHKTQTHAPIELKFDTHRGLIKVHLHTNFGWNPIKIYKVIEFSHKKAEGLARLQGKLLEGINWNLACRWSNHAFCGLKGLGKRPQIYDTKPNQRQKYVIEFMIKNSARNYVYCNCLQQWDENQSVVVV